MFEHYKIKKALIYIITFLTIFMLGFNNICIAENVVKSEQTETKENSETTEKSDNKDDSKLDTKKSEENKTNNGTSETNQSSKTNENESKNSTNETDENSKNLIIKKAPNSTTEEGATDSSSKTGNNTTTNSTTDQNTTENGETQDDTKKAEIPISDAHPKKNSSKCRVSLGEYTANDTKAITGETITEYEYYDTLEEAAAACQANSLRIKIEILVDNIEVSSTLKMDNTRKITAIPSLGKKATIKRAKGFTGTIFDCHTLYVDNIDIDGGWEDDHSGIESEGPIIKSGGWVYLSNTTLKNNYNKSSDGGGAILVTSGQSITANENTVIQNCASTCGGAIKTGGLIANDLTIDKCYSTNDGKTAGQEANGSGISIDAWAGLEAHKLTVKNCIAVNAKKGGSAVEITGGYNTSFGKENDIACNINISNNYSTGTKADGGVSGFSCTTSWAPINIYSDMVINNNKAGCTVDDPTDPKKWTISSTSNSYNSNFNVNSNNSGNIKFYTDITNKSKVGVTVVNADEKSEEVYFGTYDTTTKHSGIEKGYFADNNLLPAFDAKYAPNTVAINNVPDDNDLVIAQQEQDGISYVYKITEYPSTVEWTDENKTHEEEFVLTGKDSKSFQIPKDTAVTITLGSVASDGSHNYWWINDLETRKKVLTVTGNMASGISQVTNLTGQYEKDSTHSLQDKPQYYSGFTYGGEASENDKSVVTYTFTTLETAPNTGLKVNIVIIVFLAIIVIGYGTILIKMRLK